MTSLGKLNLFLEEQSHEGLVRRKVKVHPKEGKEFEREQWVRPEEVTQEEAQKEKPQEEEPSVEKINYEEEKKVFDRDLGTLIHKKAEYESLPSEFTPQATSVLKDNADKHLEQYERFFDASTFNKTRSIAYRLINNGAKVKGKFSPSDLQELVHSSINKLLYQEARAWERQLSDHGIRHIYGNIDMSNRIMNAMGEAGIKISAKDRFLCDVVMVNHDLGYTVGSAAKTVPGTKRHPKFSQEWFDNERVIFKKYFSNEELDEMSNFIVNHGQREIDWGNRPLLSAICVSDNLSIFHEEKLPSLFKYVDGSIDSLFAMQKALRDNDDKAFDEAKNGLEKKVEDTKLPEFTKSWLKRAVVEVSKFTPKFIIPMLIGKIQGFDFSREEGLEVDIKEDPFDSQMADFFDMGQKAYTNLAESYGVELADNDKIDFKKEGKTLLRVRIFRNPVTKSLELSLELEKADREGLVPKKVTVKGKRKTYQATRWVRPVEIASVKDRNFKDLLELDYNELLSGKSKKVKEILKNATDSLLKDREKNLDKISNMRGLSMIDSWARGTLLDIVGIRIIFAKMNGKELSRDQVKSLLSAVDPENKSPEDKTVDFLMHIGELSYTSIKDNKPSLEPSIKVLQAEMKYTQDRTRELFGDKIEVYRKIYGPTATKIKEAFKTAEEIAMDEFPLSSYSQDYIAAWAFARDKGDSILIRRAVSAGEICFSWYANPSFLDNMPEQREVVVTSRTGSFKLNKKDVIEWQST